MLSLFTIIRLWDLQKKDINSTQEGVAWLTAAGSPDVLHEGRTGTRGTGCGYPGPPNIVRDAQCHEGCLVPQGTLCRARSSWYLVPLLGSPDPLQGNHANMKHHTALSPADKGDEVSLSLLSHIQWQAAMTPQVSRTQSLHFRRWERKVKYSCQSGLHTSFNSYVHVLLRYTINTTSGNTSFRKNWSVELQDGFRNIYSFNLKYYSNSGV